MEHKRSSKPAAEPENKSHCKRTEPAAEPQQRPRRNPRLVIGNIDYFELLMEQDEQ